MNDSDMQLVERYARAHDEDAFAELVRRHLDLVYSAALRQLLAPQLAEEVAQSAFLSLARSASSLAPDSIVSGWLYMVTRRTAIDVIRREARRRTREQIAAELNAMNDTATEWPRIEHLLDEVMEALNDTERTAVLLRYFQNKSLREVGHTLGISEDAAQKRISRAIDRLRELFGERGIIIGSSGLASLLTAQAVQAAPAGMAAAILSSPSLAVSAVGATTTSSIPGAIGASAWSKTLLASALVASVGSGLFGLRQHALLRDQDHAFREQQGRQAEQVAHLTGDRDAAAVQVQQLREENARLRREAAEVHRLRGDMVRLRQQVAEATRGDGAEQASTVPKEEQKRAFGTELQDMGAATPERAATSLIWAASTGNAARLAELLELPEEVAEHDALNHYSFFAKRFSNAWSQFEFLSVQGSRQNPDGTLTLRQTYRDTQTGRTNPFPFTLRHHDTGWKVVVEGKPPATLPTE